MHTIKRTTIDNSSPPAFRYQVVFETATGNPFVLFDCDSLQLAIIVVQTLNGGSNTGLQPDIPGVVEVFN